MSDSHRRDRGALVALALSLVAVVLVCLIANQPAYQVVGKQDTPATDYPQDQYGPSEGHWWPEFAARDTYAQWAMVALTFAATAISIWAVRLVNDTLAETRRAVRAAEDANRVSREIGQAQVRAYLNIEYSKIVPPKKPAIFPFLDGMNAVVAFRNSGQSPAYDVRLRRKESTIGALVEDFDRGLGDIPFVFIGTIGASAAFSYDIENFLEPDEYSSLKNQTCFTFFFGEVIYRDCFGDWWRTQYSLRVEAFSTDRVKIFPHGHGNKTVRLEKGEQPEDS